MEIDLTKNSRVVLKKLLSDRFHEGTFCLSKVDRFQYFTGIGITHWHWIAPLAPTLLPPVTGRATPARSDNCKAMCVGKGPNETHP